MSNSAGVIVPVIVSPFTFHRSALRGRRAAESPSLWSWLKEADHYPTPANLLIPPCELAPQVMDGGPWA